MELRCGAHRLHVTDTPATVVRATFTPGDLRVSRQIFQIAREANDAVRVTACRAGLRVRCRRDADYQTLEAGESAVVQVGGAVELLRPAKGADGIVAVVWSEDDAHVVAEEPEPAEHSLSLAAPSLQVHPTVPSLPAPKSEGKWIKVSKSRPSPIPTQAVMESNMEREKLKPEEDEPREEEEHAAAKRHKSDEAARFFPHVCSTGRMRSLVFVASAMQVRPGLAVLLDETFQSLCSLDECSVLQCEAATFGEGKVSFWAAEAKKRWLVCEFEVFGLSKARSGELKVALCFKLCENASQEDLASFLGDAFGELHGSVDSCRAARDSMQLQVEFEDNEAEQSLASLFSSLSTECEPAPQPSAVATSLKRHQLQALQWMLDKELTYVHQLPPFWQERPVYGTRPWTPENAFSWGTLHISRIRTFLLIVQRFNEERHWYAKFPKPLIRVIANMIPSITSYYHSLTNVETLRRPRGAMGGILADDMGLGKTLTTVALVVSNSAVELSSLAALKQGSPVDYSTFYDSLLADAPDGAPESARPAAKIVAPQVPRVVAHAERRPTLIVCPMSVISNWCDQIEAHLGADCASVMVHHGAKKVKDVEHIARQDIVCTTYGTLVSEFGSEDISMRGPLSRVRWRRLILDEAHYIRNPASKSFKAALAVDAIYRWCLTATPLQNKTGDLYPLFAVINEEVFSDRSSFKKLISDPIQHAKAEGFIRLRTLMLSACLRRTKDSVDAFGKPLIALPPKLVKHVRMLLSDKEHLVYKAYDTQAIELFQKLEKQGIEVVKAKFQFLLVVILRLRQLCDHIALCKDLEQFFVDAREAIQSGDVGRLTHKIATAEGCCMCEETTKQMYVLPCAHVHCEQHIAEARDASQCAMCSDPVEASEIQKVSIPATKKKRLTLARGQEPSTKMVKILQIIQDVRAKGGPKAKVVLFSQFTQFLDICEDFLKQSGVSTVRIDGSVSRGGRITAMHAFNAGRPEVMLASLMAAGVGINLLGGCNVIIADPWWNVAVENQAMDRVHRIGQTHAVTVHRLVVAGSIEERLLDVQDAKAQLASAALVLRSPEDLRDMNVKMLSKLFGGTVAHVRGKRGRLDKNASARPFRRNK